MQSREWIRTDACSLAAQSKEPILLFSHQISRRHTPYVKSVMGLGARIGRVVKIKQKKIIQKVAGSNPRIGILKFQSTPENSR